MLCIRTVRSDSGIRFAVSEPEEPNDEQLAYIQSTMDDTVIPYQ